MLLSDGERLILAMLCDLLRRRNSHDHEAIDPDFVLRSIQDNQLWGLKVKYAGVFADETYDPIVIAETRDILTMYSALGASYQRLTDAERARVDISDNDLRFPGFDANNEPQYHVAKYLIENFESYDKFKERDLNSHWPYVDNYRRMLNAYKAVVKQVGGAKFTADQLAQVLKTLNV